MSKTTVIDQDFGFNKLVEDIEKLTSKSLTVGITEDSPRAQFKRGISQEFRPETAGLLIRKPIDAKKGDLIRKLTRIGKQALIGEIDIDKKLEELGNEIKFDMSRHTDPPPQLRNAIIVKVKNEA